MQHHQIQVRTGEKYYAVMQLCSYTKFYSVKQQSKYAIMQLCSFGRWKRAITASRRHSLYQHCCLPYSTLIDANNYLINDDDTLSTTNSSTRCSRSHVSCWLLFLILRKFTPFGLWKLPLSFLLQICQLYIYLYTPGLVKPLNGWKWFLFKCWVLWPLPAFWVSFRDRKAGNQSNFWKCRQNHECFYWIADDCV